MSLVVVVVVVVTVVVTAAVALLVFAFVSLPLTTVCLFVCMSVNASLLPRT